MSELLKHGDLLKLYDQADSAQKALFAEQRSNVLLVAGEHYARRGREAWRRLRRNHNISQHQKLRLTNNHIQKITKSYVNNLITHAPGVQVQPKNKSEFTDQKAAELHQSVWADMKERHKLDKFFHHLAKDYVELGEAWCKISFDPDEGQFLGYETEVDEDGEEKKVRSKNTPILRKFTGDVSFERIHAFNVLVDPGARSYEEARWVCYRKMVDTKELKKQFEGDEEKLKLIGDSSRETWQIFHHYGYSDKRKNQTMVREFYFKPTSDYPNGFYYITTEAGILFMGELPHAIFPIAHCGFDEASTSPRSFSIIKQLRPFQSEINRACSKIAEHQITIGDDKLVVSQGGSVNAGGLAHGVKILRTNGQVTHLPGRSGEQYLPYLEFQIQQMYFAAGVEEDSQEKGANLDPYTMLFRSMRQKKQYSIYAVKFEGLLKEICFKALKYAKKNYSTKMVISVLDKKERVNISEFKSADDLSWQIALEEVSEDIETKMGRQIALNHVLQFAGNQLQGEDLGIMIKNMPFVNNDAITQNLTIDEDNVVNDIVSMDKGEFIPATPTDNHQYYIRRLTHRTKMKDFQFLPEAAKQAYAIRIQQHEQIMLEQQQQAAQLSSGLIPSGGFLVTTDIRVPRADDPTRTERAKIPVEALAWLIDTLEKQGQSQALLQSLPDSSQAAIGSAVAAQGPQQ